MSQPTLLDWIRHFLNAAQPIPQEAIVAAGAVALLVVLVIVWRMVRRRRPKGPRVGPQLMINLATLGEAGPPEGPPTLEFYHIPVRVAAVVLAPVGRIRELPPDDGLSPLFDAILPGLDRVVALHHPTIRRWPVQWSARGFAHSFFANARLPGEGGKGTIWSSAAGVFKLHGKPLMAGLVLCAAAPNNFGQALLDSEEKWLGCLRVKYGRD